MQAPVSTSNSVATPEDGRCRLPLESASAKKRRDQRMGGLSGGGGDFDDEPARGMRGDRIPGPAFEDADAGGGLAGGDEGGGGGRRMSPHAGGTAVTAVQSELQKGQKGDCAQQ